MSTESHTFDDFFLFYLRQHSHRANRMLHAVGTLLGLAIAMAALLCIIPGSGATKLPITFVTPAAL